MQALGCIVHWEGMLLAEWVGVLLSLASPLLKEAADVDAVRAVAAHLSDILMFQDGIMAAHLPSELSAGLLHASAMLCTKRFARYAFVLRIGHLCRVQEYRS
jgi:hypothetical protein